VSDRQPVSAVNITAQYEDHQLQPRDEAAVIPWEEAQERLTTSGSYWFATTQPGGGPHVRPVLGVFVDGVLYTTSNPNARKARNLDGDPHCAATASTDGMDLVVEGTGAKVEDEATLQDVFDAYRSKYAFWQITVRDGAFDAPFGAPTAGAPPYQPYAVTPTRIYGFGTDERFAPLSTRWEFE
jgi:nitroimidazol reductase NimA-like FMN-containing flavoprotein (pyridoxamine 5'-phosphate oxidase superfamily)